MRKYDLDIKEFWKENEKCFKPFSVDKPRVPLTFILEDHFIQHLMNMESTVRYYTDPVYTLKIHKEANDLLENEIGARFYPEDNIPYVKSGFEVIMGAKRIISEGNSPWIESDVQDIEDVVAIIERAEKLDFRRDAIPEDWYKQKERLKKETGKTLHFEHSWNGPATIACNLLGTTNTCIFIMEEPEIMKEFFDIMAEKYIEYREVVVMEDKGLVDKEGIGVNDDNCYLFPPAQYKKFCYPFLKRFFQAFAPLPEHKRRQHSDSNMGHLMGILNDLGINEVNFGPTIHPADIRKQMPNAIIHGQMPPFVLRNGTAEEIISIVRRDVECVGADGGLVESLAGVVPEGTPLENIRIYMWAVDKYGRY